MLIFSKIFLFFLNKITSLSLFLPPPQIILMSNALRENCTEFLEKKSLPDAVRKMAETLSSELDSRFKKIEEHQIFAQSSFLDPRFKKHCFQNEKAYEKACSDLKDLAGIISIQNTSAVPNKDDAPVTAPPTKKLRRIWQLYDKKVDSIIKEQDLTAAGALELAKYLEEPLVTSDVDPIKWWSEKKHAYPKLYEIFLQKFCIAATSVPSERIFSKAGQILVDRRNRLSGKKLTKILFLNKNLPK